MAKAFVDYTIPGFKGLTLSGGIYYTGSKYYDSANLYKIAAYTLVDLGIRYRTEALGHPLIFNLYVSNVTDEDYWATINQLGTPRNIAFSVRAEF